jgi:hypothetical protein
MTSTDEQGPTQFEDSSAKAKEAPKNGDFPNPATGFRDYLIDAGVAWYRYNHDASDYDDDFDEEYAESLMREFLSLEERRVVTRGHQATELAASRMVTGGIALLTEDGEQRSYLDLRDWLIGELDRAYERGAL